MTSSNQQSWAQQAILSKIAEKEKASNKPIWDEYEESYSEIYSDYHSDYYDSAAEEQEIIEKIRQAKIAAGNATNKSNKIKNMIQKIMKRVKIR